MYDSPIGLGDRGEVGISGCRCEVVVTKSCRLDWRLCTSHESAFNRALSGNLCDRDNRVDLIGGEKTALDKQLSSNTLSIMLT